MTTNQMNEIQLVYCRATSGYFVLYLDGKTSDRIPYNSPGTVVRSALMVGVAGCGAVYCAEMPTCLCVVLPLLRVSFRSP